MQKHKCKNDNLENKNDEKLETKNKDEEMENKKKCVEKLKTGGFTCDLCHKVYKTKITLQKHKCKVK